MLCPNCNGKNTVEETISSQILNYRQRKCSVCKMKFYTKETLIEPEEAEPMFREYLRERSRKARLRKKGIDYEPKYSDGREKEVKVKRTVRPLF